jgi:predicted MFS family arabinose efflux permease
MQNPVSTFGASPFVTAMLLGVWGLAGAAAPVGWRTWLATTLPQDAEAGGVLMAAAAGWRCWPRGLRPAGADRPRP